MIIWAASSHLIYNTTCVFDQTDKNFKHLKPMGSLIKKKYLDKYYFLAFTPFQVKIGFKGYFGLAKSKIKSKEKSFEEFVNNDYGCDYAFYSLRNSKNIDYLKRKDVKSSNILWARNVKMDLSKVCEYTRQFPCTFSRKIRILFIIFSKSSIRNFELSI